MNKHGRGMFKETYEHIINHIDSLELDLQNGLILNRNSNTPCTSTGYLKVKKMSFKGTGEHLRQYTPPKGKDVKHFKLTEEVVQEIRKRYRNGEGSYRSLAEYGVSKTTLGHAIIGETWSHVEQ